MFTRYLSSAAAGAFVTASLLWLMQSLVDLAAIVETKARPRYALEMIRIPDDTPVEANLWLPPPKPRPNRAPPTVPPTENTTASIPVRTRHAPVTPGGPRYQGIGLPNGNGPVINVINAQPEYPPAAAHRGLEGYVVVRFDVTPAGSVDNVTIVESSHRLFESAAVKAAYRSRYQPRMVDGEPFSSRGLQRLYRFELEQ